MGLNVCLMFSWRFMRVSRHISEAFREDLDQLPRHWFLQNIWGIPSKIIKTVSTSNGVQGCISTTIYQSLFPLCQFMYFHRFSIAGDGFFQTSKSFDLNTFRTFQVSQVSITAFDYALSFLSFLSICFYMCRTKLITFCKNEVCNNLGASPQFPNMRSGLGVQRICET